MRTRSSPSAATGCAIEDIDGNVFLDFAAGIAVNSTGHSHPDVVKAIQRQAANLLHMSASDFYLPIYAQAAAELARISPIPRPGAHVHRQHAAPRRSRPASSSPGTTRAART